MNVAAPLYSLKRAKRATERERSERMKTSALFYTFIVSLFFLAVLNRLLTREVVLFFKDIFHHYRLFQALNFHYLNLYHSSRFHHYRLFQALNFHYLNLYHSSRFHHYRLFQALNFHYLNHSNHLNRHLNHHLNRFKIII